MSDEIQRALGRIEGSIEAIKGDTLEIKKTLDSHGDRIGAVETFKIQAIALGSAAGAVVSGVWHVAKIKIGS